MGKNIIQYAALAIGIIILSFGLNDYFKIESLESEGEIVIGEIHSRPILNTGKGRSSYKLVVDYQPEGNIVYRKEFTVSEAFYNTANGKDSISIRYLKNEPTVSGISGNITEQKQPLYVGIGAFMISLLVFFFIKFAIKNRHLKT